MQAALDQAVASTRRDIGRAAARLGTKIDQDNDSRHALAGEAARRQDALISQVSQHYQELAHEVGQLTDRTAATRAQLQALTEMAKTADASADARVDRAVADLRGEVATAAKDQATAGTRLSVRVRRVELLSYFILVALVILIGSYLAISLAG